MNKLNSLIVVAVVAFFSMQLSAQIGYAQESAKQLSDSIALDFKIESATEKPTIELSLVNVSDKPITLVAGLISDSDKSDFCDWAKTAVGFIPIPPRKLPGVQRGESLNSRTLPQPQITLKPKQKLAITLANYDLNSCDLKFPYNGSFGMAAHLVVRRADGTYLDLKSAPHNYQITWLSKPAYVQVTDVFPSTNTAKIDAGTVEGVHINDVYCVARMFYLGKDLYRLTVQETQPHSSLVTISIVHNVRRDEYRDTFLKNADMRHRTFDYFVRTGELAYPFRD